MIRDYDYLIIGSGLYGAVFAREMTNKGKRCLVIDKRKEAGGNLRCEYIEGINVHRYGPHIFHTDNKAIWDYVNTHCEFNHFVYSPMANYKGMLYNLPFNMNTFYQLWKIKSPLEVRKYIENQTSGFNKINPRNLAEHAIKMVGEEVFNKFIKGYTEKQWGREASKLPCSIIKRIPIRYSFDNNYFDDRYQGVPVGGYNVLINSLLNGIEVRTGIDFFSARSHFSELAQLMVFTGKLDEFYEYRFGSLAYRSLRFETEYRPINNYQGVAVVNYTEKEIPYTRIIEHKHFEFGKQPGTVITKEYPIEWKKGNEAYYPVNDLYNNNKFKKYQKLADCESNIIFGGRLAEYKYYDMHQIIASAIKKVKTLHY
ncbi:UDP-galactopyranose mutase [Pedobacter suwonensis]|uniref:UDP-galactopyranose mutase n=2 Tax=Pedobacter suwonensis TaxID=332999 RepID=A0A1I0T9Q7_9SPHI|nr:UDP-galactopyranose mutase [Pedobacter suwonensis]